MDGMVSIFAQSIQFQKLIERLKHKEEIWISNLRGSAISCLISEIRYKITECILLVVPEEEAEQMQDDLNALGLNDTLLFPHREVLEGETIPACSEITGQRINVLTKLTEKSEMKEKIKGIFITSPKTLQEKLPSPEIFKKGIRRISVGEKIEREEMVKYLVDCGYNRCPQVMFKGDFSVRGGIVDVFASSSEKPARIELLGNEIVSLREFDPQAQSSIKQIETLLIPSAKEYPLDTCSNLLNYLPQESLIFLQEPSNIEDTKISTDLKKYRLVHYSASAIDPVYNPVDFSMQPLTCIYTVENPYRENRLSALRAEIKNLQKTGYSILLLAEYRGQAERFVELLKEYDLYPKLINLETENIHSIPGGGIGITVLNLSRGWIDPNAGLGVIVLKEIFGVSKVRRHKKLEGWTKFEQVPEPLSVGDYVVHINYGIGLFQGINTIPVDGVLQDFFTIEYAGGNKLYIPLEQSNLLQKYIGRIDPPPPLDSLDSTRWQTLRKRVKKSVQEYAKELLELYAWRKSIKRHPFSPDTHWQQEFEIDFPYEETPDQIRTIIEVKEDMERDIPMDRLICGDVGYGKTEVAMRAAFKAVMDGKQVCLLVPTTILAEQHFQTFCERMAPYPVIIEMLSRFKSRAEQKKILNDLADGRIDIIIGTHRLLQGDVKFHNLGLLIVDEEQRFGVLQKEQLKRLKKDVDVLTLSATPIPRTLYMSVHGIRDMSIIDTPPPERLSIKTFVMEFNPSVIRTAILREMERKGQIFYVHNRIRTMTSHFKNLKDLVPEARIAMAHGQMDEKVLEEIMLRFMNREYDLLLSTDIVGAGLDIANVNTIIITEAQDFGLAQLYQLRGRVGRAGHQAYAYIFYNPARMLTEAAAKRLKAIAEFVNLGSGLRLAMRDLEIRGAGNILGKEQHGHIQKVGLELYCKMLEEAISELKGEPVKEEIEPVLKLKVEAYIPDEYVGGIEQKIMLYKKMLRIKNTAELEKLRYEMKDRYGNLPGPVKMLLEIVEIRTLAKNAGINLIEVKGRDIVFSRDTKNLKFKISKENRILQQIKKILLSFPKI